MEVKKFKRPIRKIQWLKVSSSDEWISLVLDNPIEVLIDHAHCERKAAGVAIQLMFRYVSDPKICEALSPIAREELEHFERVLRLIKKKGHTLRQLPAPPYGSKLSKNIRKNEPNRMLDSFLVASLIEARSHERMSLISLNSNDETMKTLYLDLLNSEEKHFGIYWKMSLDRFSKNIVESRMNELSDIESEILSTLHIEPRMHS